MLILDRKQNKSIVIGNNIIVTVVDFYTDYSGETVVKLGVEAPKRIPVDRKEVRKKRIDNIDKLLNGNIPKH